MCTRPNSHTHTQPDIVNQLLVPIYTNYYIQEHKCLLILLGKYILSLSIYLRINGLNLNSSHNPFLTNTFVLSCVQLCNPMDCSSQGFSVHGIFQTRILEWVAISSSKGYSWPMDWTHVSCIAGIFFTSISKGVWKPLGHSPKLWRP